MATKKKSGSKKAKAPVKEARSKPGKPRASVRKVAARGDRKPARKTGAKASVKKTVRKRASSPKTARAPARKSTASKTRKHAKKPAVWTTASVKKAGVRKPSRATTPTKNASKSPATKAVAKTTAAKKVTVEAVPKTQRVAIKALGGHVCNILLDGDCARDARREDIDRAITRFIALEPSALTDVEEHVFRYYLDCKDYFEPGEPGYLEIGSASDVWKHVGFGPEATVGREGNTVYISLGCNCDWEPEHGLQIVFKEGQRVNKVGPFDGHFTNSHAYDDESLEDVIYRPREGIAPPDGA